MSGAELMIQLSGRRIKSGTDLILLPLNLVWNQMKFSCHKVNMAVCKVQTWLAYAMAAYALASLYYAVRTRTVGTPFNDSLSPQQLAIKEASSDLRRSIFFQGVLGAILLLAFLQPFAQC